MTLSRRHFLEMLGIAPMAFNAHKVYFDMGRRLWMPQEIPITIAEPVEFPLELLNHMSQRYLDAGIINTFNVTWLHDLRAAQDSNVETQRIKIPSLLRIPDLIVHN